MNQRFAIEVEGMAKCYRLNAQMQRHDTLRDLLSCGGRALMRSVGRRDEPRRKFWALRDVDLAIRPGENVGIIGLNGAGKSTLLKILTRITAPTAGRALVMGRVGALLEVGTGFHWELTGRENTFLYGAILGMRKDEIRRKFDDIVSFAGVAEFIDTPVKRYSSGMYVRLAFAVAAHLRPDIMLIDEVLSVGDLPFQRKCIDFAKNLQRAQATILFVSHNMFSIKTMCDRVIYLKGGRVAFDGPTDQGIAIYEKDCLLSGLAWAARENSDSPIRFNHIELASEDGQQKTVFGFGEKLKIQLDYTADRTLENPNVIVAFIRSDGVACCNFSTEADNIEPGFILGSGVITLQTPPLKLTAERYSIQVIVWEKGFHKLVCALSGPIFHVRHPLFDTHFGVFHEDGHWEWHSGPETSHLRDTTAEPPSATRDLATNPAGKQIVA